MRHFVMSTLVAALLTTGGCDAASPTTPTFRSLGGVTAASQLPADGNGNKTIVPVFEQRQVSCGTATLTRTIEGWFQLNLIGETDSDVQRVDIHHLTYTFMNA